MTTSQAHAWETTARPNSPSSPLRLSGTVLAGALLAQGALALGSAAHAVLPAVAGPLSFVLAPVALVSLACTLGDFRRELARRAEAEQVLRRHASLLSSRIEARTAELNSETQERLRLENSFRGKAEVLEMLARDQPTGTILARLARNLAAHRSPWGCAIHLAEGGELRLQASSDLPSRLGESLARLHLSVGDIPEVESFQSGQVVACERLASAKRPWTELLLAHRVQSLVSVPILLDGEERGGTFTLYSRLPFSFSPAELDLVKHHGALAGLVLSRKRMQQELEHRASHDALTHLPNRFAARRHLAHALALAARRSSGVTLLHIDLDGFRKVNDTYGHVAGDLLLTCVAARFQGALRQSDMLARLDSDEFVAILENTPYVPGSAEQVAGKLLQALALPIPVGAGEQVHIHASIGISVAPTGDKEDKQLKYEAELALARSKREKLGIVLYTPQLEAQEASSRNDLEQELAEGILHKRFSLAFQPLVGADGRVRGFEALLRFSHSRQGPLPPSTFIPILEQTGAIVPVGLWVLRAACQQLRAWHLAGHPGLRIAVNVSAVQLARPDFFQEVCSTLAAHGLHPSLLELEVTETSLIQNLSGALAQLEQLRAHGVTLAIDDFGTGYCSLNYLHKLPVHRLKIDRSFVQGAEEENGTLPIVDAIVAMAAVKGIQITAEGIETPAQWQIMRSRGCDLHQGYLFGRPVPAAEATQLLKSSLALSPEAAELPSETVLTAPIPASASQPTASAFPAMLLPAALGAQPLASSEAMV